MNNYKNWLWVLLFGSLWGIAEVGGGELLYRNGIPRASVWLAAWGVFMLALSRGFLNKVGSSTAAAAVACLFKLVNAAPFFCHLLGIFLLGLAFDAAATLLIRDEQKASWKASLTGISAVYAGFASFAFAITYIVRYEYWVPGGLPKVLNHIFVSGSLAALAAALIVPFGIKAGVSSDAVAKRHPGWTYACVLAALVILWTLGRFAA